jgi:hypothetical protein
MLFYYIFQDALNKVVIKDMRSNKDNITNAVLAVEYVMKESELSIFLLWFLLLHLSLQAFTDTTAIAKCLF